jgi:dipeptide/tripeptide permease
LPSAITKLVKPTDFGFLIGAIPILLFFARLSHRAEPQERAGLKALLPVYLAGGTFFMVLHLNGSAMTTWADENTARHSGRPDPVVAVADAMSPFAGDTYPKYYANAAADVPRPARSMLLPIATDPQAKMYGKRRVDEAALADLTARLPADVKLEEIPLRGELTAQQKADKKLSVEVFAKVEVIEGTDSHGLPDTTVKVADGATALRRVAFVREKDGVRAATFLVTQARFDALYQGNPPELPHGRWLKSANSELYQSWNAFFVVALTPLVMWWFVRLLRRGVDFSTARKILAGMVITAIAALFMALAGFLSADGAEKVSGLWLMGFYAIVTVGELCLSPMALSLVTKLSPKRFVGLTMGGWFFATAVGNKFSGFLGVLQGAMPPTWFFLTIAGAVALVALYIKLVLPRLDAAIKQYGA